MTSRRPVRATAALLLAALAACSGGDDGGSAVPPKDASPAPPAEVPAALDQFLDGVAPHGEVPVRAAYEVLQKLGGETVVVRLAVDPPAWRIEVDDVVVTESSTCVGGDCTDGVDESRLTQFGVTSRFFSSAPAQQLLVDAGRTGAREPELTTRTVAGVELRCAAVPVGAAAPTTACLTPDGIFGFVEDTTRRVALIEYQPST